MAVVGFARPRIKREGTVSQEKQSGSVREYRREFIVETDNRYDGPLTVLSAPGLPQLYFPYATLHEQDDFALCTRVHASPLSDKSPFHWLVEADYSTEHEDEKNNENGPDDPLREPAEISFDFENYRVPVTGAMDETGGQANGQNSDNPKFMDPKNVNGEAPRPFIFTKGIVNSAGEPFDPPAEMDESRPILTITRNELYFNPMLATAFQDAVNKDDFLGARPRQAKVKGISAARQQKGGIRYWRVTYVIAFKRETWDLQLLDHGSYYFTKKEQVRAEKVNPADLYYNAVKAYRDAGGEDDNYAATLGQTAAADAERQNENIDAGLKADGSALDETGGVKTPFLDSDGNRIVGLLNGDVKTGEKLPDGENPKFLTFRVYKELPFSLLQLPQAIRA